jgi:transcriptional regulator with XRE-family HTH domain
VTTLSNEKIGQLLGVSHATVSRYKSGDRFPELDNMARIADVFGWGLDEQYAARQDGTYADKFNERLVVFSNTVGAVGEETPANQ